MRTAIVLVSAALAAACGGDDDAVGSVDAAPGADVDAATPVDGATADADDPGDNCGQLQPDVRAITGTEGLAIGDDGTLYYSQNRGIGRLLPGQARDDDWAALSGSGGQVWGLALTSTHLYVGYPSDDSIWRVDRVSGEAAEWLADAGDANGVIIGADGALYYSDFGGGEVYRVDLASKDRTQVTDASPAPGEDFGQPNGLYSVDAEHLLVLAYGAGQVWELTLAEGEETDRALRATIEGGARLDGITRGPDGSWYLTDNRGGDVVRRPADFAEPAGAEDIVSTSEIGGAANLVFGRGALGCNDLYVTSSGAMVRITID
jgi:sugar lactone lactonase YvrE